MFILIQLVVGWFYGHVVEYITHRWIFHNRKLSPLLFKQHYAQHHARARRGIMMDEEALKPPKLLDKEITSLFWAFFAHFPLGIFFPYFYIMLAFSAASYYLTHRKAHRSIEWARDNLTWHYDHHMAPNQEVNWGVRSDLIDRILGTREYYKGTRKEIIRFRNFQYRGQYTTRLIS